MEMEIYYDSLQTCDSSNMPQCKSAESLSTMTGLVALLVAYLYTN